MKTIHLALTLLMCFIMFSAMQCRKECNSGSIMLNDSKSWLPVPGTTTPIFQKDNGENDTLLLKAEDTLSMYGSVYEYSPDCMIDQRIMFLYLNANQEDYIYFKLSDVDKLFLTSKVNGTTPILHNDVMSLIKEQHYVTYSTKTTIGSHNYNEVLLIKAKTSTTLDSIYLARNVGVVGFKYKQVHYTLL
jgi:hypothetical protein